MRTIQSLAVFLCILGLCPIAGFSQGAKSIDSLVNVAKVAKDDTNKVRELNNLSKYYLTIEPDRSFDYAKQTVALAQKLGYNEGLFNGNQDMGAYYYYRSDLKNSRDYFLKALTFVNLSSNADKRPLAKVYSNLAAVCVKQLNYSEAIDYSEKSMEIATELKDSSTIATVLTNRAIFYMNISDYPSALSCLLKSLSINENRSEKQKMSTNYYYLGYTYMQQNSLDKALDYLRQSVTASTESKDRFQLAQALDKIGEVYQIKHDWSRALDYFQQAIAIGREVGSFDNIISSTQNIGMIYNEQGKYREAIQSLSNALELSKQVGDKLGTGNSYWYLGTIYQKMGDYKTAIDYAGKSLDVFKELNVKTNEASALTTLSDCYKSLGDYKTGLSYLTQYNSVRDSIFSDATIQSTAEMEAKYGLEKKGKEIALLTKDKQIQALELKRESFLKWFFIVSLSLASMLFFFVFRNYRTTQLLKLQTLRNKIASDLHDEVGSTLSSIAIFSEIARQQSREVAPMLDQIGESSHKMLESMADIVWTINPANDNFEKVILRMRSFAYELLGAKKIDFEFDSDESIDQMKLPMEVRKNLYLIFKEATNNIVKYSEANRASFAISSSKDTLTMLIRDNGKGFELDKQAIGIGNGLKNMKNRAVEIGAKFLIESELGKGTTIQLLLKTA